MKKDCPHQILSLMRSGPDVSASCAKCWKSIFKTKEVVIWRYGLVGRREKKAEEVGGSQSAPSVLSCEHKILKLYRSDRYVGARCLNCDALISVVPEIRLLIGSVVKPRIEVASSANSAKQRQHSGDELSGETPGLANP